MPNVGQTKSGRALHLMGQTLDERHPEGDILHDMYKRWGFLGWSICGEALSRMVSGYVEPTCKDCLAKLAPSKPTLRDKIEALPSYDMEWEGLYGHDIQVMREIDHERFRYHGDWIRRDEVMRILDEEL